MTVVERKYRLGLLRFLNRKPEGEWYPYYEMLRVAVEERLWTTDEVTWYRLALRECVILGEVQMRPVRTPSGATDFEVRIKEKGRKAIAIEELLR